jgi:ubiquinone/menaquinone biosynthesis C-methylase UbiE
LHHAPDTEKTLQEAFRVLKTGGSARIMLYHRHSLNEIMHRISGILFEDKDELCPVVRRFTKDEVRAMCKDFSSVEIDVDYVYGEGYGKLFKLTPLSLYKLLSKYLGWHLMIVATK